MKKYCVFVYGSLLKGLGNHRILQEKNVKYICEDMIHAKLYTCHWDWPFAVLSKSNKDSIHGEVYDVPLNVFEELDHLEGYHADDPESSLFLRKSVVTIKNKHHVYTYEGGTHLQKQQSFLIKNGDWKNALKNGK